MLSDLFPFLHICVDQTNSVRNTCRLFQHADCNANTIIELIFQDAILNTSRECAKNDSPIEDNLVLRKVKKKEIKKRSTIY